MKTNDNSVGVCQNIPDFTTEDSLKRLFCEKRTGRSKKGSLIEIFTGHFLKGYFYSEPPSHQNKMKMCPQSISRISTRSEDVRPAKNFIGEPFLDQPVLFLQNRLFDKASL
jgi:hypothetical protein